MYEPSEKLIANMRELLASLHTANRHNDIMEFIDEAQDLLYGWGVTTLAKLTKR